MAEDPLWAPWRLRYILSDKEKNGGTQPDVPTDQLLPDADPKCFLCQAVADTMHDRQRHVVLRKERAIALLNLYPYNNGHTLVSPVRHVDHLDKLTDEEQLESCQTITQIVQLLEKTMRPDGFNIGLNLGHGAGAGLPDHLHWHVVPRWNGDTNFMLVTASTNVIPQSLEALWLLLAEELGQKTE